MAYDVKAVANYFLDLAAANNTSLTPMKLQKLVFFAHGWHLGLYSEPLIVDPVQAWKFGPVVPTLYHEFKHVGAGAITSRASDFDFDRGCLLNPTVDQDDSRTRDLLNQIWKVYGKLSGPALSNLTHLQGTPWYVVWARSGGALQTVIPDEEIQQYFAQQAAQNKAKSTAGNAG